MPVHFPCQSCNKRVSVARRYAGKARACPHCGEKVRVPRLDAASNFDDQSDEVRHAPRRKILVYLHRPRAVSALAMQFFVLSLLALFPIPAVFAGGRNATAGTALIAVLWAALGFGLYTLAWTGFLRGRRYGPHSAFIGGILGLTCLPWLLLWGYSTREGVSDYFDWCSQCSNCRAADALNFHGILATTMCCTKCWHSVEIGSEHTFLDRARTDHE